MKVGILTFHFGTNYGGVLQCKALQETIKSHGHNVEVIDFHITKRRSRLRQLFDRAVSITGLADIIQILTSLKNKKNAPTKNKCLSLTEQENDSLANIFHEYRNSQLILSQYVDEYTISEIANKYDCIVIGSDQVWADIHEEIPVFLGGWIPEYSGRLLSYAACSPLDRVQRPYRKRNKKLLCIFSGLSTRDTHTKHVVLDSLGLKGVVVADPTMIYDGWLSYKNETPLEGRYILVYVLRSEIDGGLENAINKVKIQYPACEVVSILSPETSITRDCRYIDRFVMPTPDEWIKLIANAAFLLTDSYHGSVFACKFNVPFIAYYSMKSGGKYRLLELSKQLNKEELFIDSVSNIKTIPTANIEPSSFANFRNTSLDWLINKLQNKNA